MYQPDEIVVNKALLKDPLVQHILECCPGVPVRIVETNKPTDIVAASELLSSASSMADRIAVGKRVLVLVSTVGDVDLFEMSDVRMVKGGLGRSPPRPTAFLLQTDYGAGQGLSSFAEGFRRRFS